MRIRITTFVSIAMLLVSLGTAWAGDNIQVNITTPSGQIAPALKLNGNDATLGTIQLFYSVNAFSFTPGNFTVFTVNMKDVHLNGNNNAVYPTTLTLKQNGSQDVTLTPDTSSFDVNTLGWSGSTNVTVAISPDVSSADGTDIVGNLNLSIPGSDHVDTPTTVQVHIRLVYPASTCLKVYDFMTDADFTAILTSTTVNLNNKLKVVSSQPGQFSDNVMVANTCSTSQSFDLSTALDPRFQTNPSNNPGIAVFSYTTAGEIDPTTFNILSFGTGTKQGQNLCLQNVTVAAGSTFLATVHSEVIKGISSTTLGTAPFAFSGTLYQTVNAGCTGTLHSLAAPNPATTSLPFTTN